MKSVPNWLIYTLTALGIVAIVAIVRKMIVKNPSPLPVSRSSAVNAPAVSPVGVIPLRQMNDAQIKAFFINSGLSDAQANAWTKYLRYILNNDVNKDKVKDGVTIGELLLGGISLDKIGNLSGILSSSEISDFNSGSVILNTIYK